MRCHTWLGLSRNMRIFAVGEKLDWIEPRFHYFQALLPENGHKPFRYEFVMGRGWGVRDDIERQLRKRFCLFCEADRWMGTLLTI